MIISEINDRINLIKEEEREIYGKGIEMEDYILLYGDKKKEDNICIINMFKNTKQIILGWTDFDVNNIIKQTEELIDAGKKQIVFMGLEIGWNRVIKLIKEKHPQIKVKVICNTQDSLLYYEYERENFFKLLQLSKEKIVDDIAFLKKGQYEVYKNLGYTCSYLRQNYQLNLSKKNDIKKQNEIIDIGIYPLNYTWDKNIFNQLCISKFIENSNLHYNLLDERMREFVNTMDIIAQEDNIQRIDEETILKKVAQNNINISCSFTEYFHPIFFLSMEQGVPCLIGNTSDLFEEGEELKKYIVTVAEDNPLINAKKVEKCLENKEKVMKLYRIWKEKYNNIAARSVEEFLKK